MVVVLSRHGVRTPTHPAELQAYAAQPWPAWSDKPGYLTERGALLMRQFGQHYRSMYAAAGLLPGTGCPALDTVFVWADVDERTRATGTALLDGLAPGCSIAVHHSSADPDTLFDPIPGTGKVSAAKSKASLVGAIGDEPEALNDAYRAQLASLDDVLGCTASTTCKRVSSVPTSIASTGDGGLAELAGGLDLAATAVENLLLEYADGKADVGWGKVDAQRLLGLLQLHTLKTRLAHENRYSAQVHGSNFMTHLLRTLEQGVTGKKVSGTRVPLNSRFIFIAGHDTQLAEAAGLLHLSWLMQGYQFNDSPPGAALVFEVHKPARSPSAQPFVRLYFTAQSLDEMRNGDGTNAKRVPVFVPGCPSLDCPFATFDRIVHEAVDPAFVTAW